MIECDAAPEPPPLLPPQPAAKSAARARRRTAGLRTGRRIAARSLRSAEDAGVPERVSARLRPDTQTVRSVPDGNPCEQAPVLRADRVDLGVPAPGQPQHLPVCGDVAHVRA